MKKAAAEAAGLTELYSLTDEDRRASAQIQWLGSGGFHALEGSESCDCVRISHLVQCLASISMLHLHPRDQKAWPMRGPDPGRAPTRASVELCDCMPCCWVGF